MEMNKKKTQQNLQDTLKPSAKMKFMLQNG